MTRPSRIHNMTSSASGSAGASDIQGRVVWEPKDASSMRMDHFRRHINQKHSLELHDYNALWEWSVANPCDFWADVWDEVGIISSGTEDGDGKRWNSVLSDPKAPLYPPPRWFEGARLNLAENLLRHRGDSVCLIQACEPSPAGETSQKDVSMTRDEVYQQVAACARALRGSGVGKGDFVAAYMPNCIATIVAFLACSSIGAIWISCAADFGPEGVLERFKAVKPKVMITCDAVRYNGRVHPHGDKVKQVLRGLDRDRLKLDLLVEVDYVGGQRALEAATPWREFLQRGKGAASIDFEQQDFNDPCWVLFSSGTTGKPKAITHRLGGMLLQLSKEHLIHGGLGVNDVFFQYTTPGWMMWNFLVGAMVAGCPLVLYDGSPLKPPSVLWDLAAKYGITVFGTSAAYLGALQRSGYSPKASHGNDLKVRQVLSTGSPLRAELYPWIIEHVGEVLIGSITGGTDICSLFAGHNEALSVRAGELQARNLGMDVDVFDQNGRPVLPGGEGDLVCKTPFPVQPLGFWGQDEDRYFESYYATIPGVWYHGDHVSLTVHGGLVMLGRSDAVLNPGGIRFGSSEIYEVLEANKHIRPLECIETSVAAALKLPTGDDEVVVLLLVLQEDCEAAKDEQRFEELVKSVKSVIRSQRSARHVPKFVRRVKNVPLTLNGKLSEVPVKKLLNGASLSSVNSSTLQNPAVLEEYVEIGKELRRELQGSAA